MTKENTGAEVQSRSNDYDIITRFVEELQILQKPISRYGLGLAMGYSPRTALRKLQAMMDSGLVAHWQINGLTVEYIAIKKLVPNKFAAMLQGRPRLEGPTFGKSATWKDRPKKP